MAETNSFYSHFRWTLILAFLSGIFIPDMGKILPKYIPTFAVYAFPLIMTYSGIDYSLQFILHSDDLDSFLYISMIGVLPLVIWSTLIVFYFIRCRDDMRCLILMWNRDFQPELWSELRELALEHHKQKAWRMISLSMKYFIFPNGILLVILVLKGDFLLPSMLITRQPEKSPRLVLFVQCLTNWAYAFWYFMLNSFFSTFMRLILVELEYIESAVKKLFSTIQMGSNGSIYSAGKIMIQVELKAHEHNKLNHDTEQRLFKLISYHSKILRFAHQVEKIFGPSFLCQVFMPSMVMSQTIYGVAMRNISAGSAGFLFPSIGFMALLCYLSCSIGEEVYTKSVRCMDATFYGNWMAYSVGMQKLLIPMIAVAKQRPIIINPYGLVPMMRETFLSLGLFQYKFYRFISDTYNH